jgi:DNA-binding response OmpR family regulator
MTGRSRRPRILITEDEPLIAAYVEAAVGDLGAECVGPFARVDPALRAASTEPLDGALLDIALADGDAYRIASALAARQIPFAFVTAYSRSEVDREWADRAYVAKPFVEAGVHRFVRELLPPEAGEAVP